MKGRFIFGKISDYGFVLVLILMYLAIASCENDLSEIHKFVDPPELVEEYALDVEILYSDSAVVKAKIKSPKVTTTSDSKNPGMEFPEGLRVQFFNEQGQTTSWLTANYAIRFEKDEYMVVQDSVVFQSSNGNIMKTEELTWDEKQSIVFTNRYVKFIKPNGEVILGYGFKTNEDFTRYEIYNADGFLRLDGLPTDL